jgi:multiple sugar transport system permease protein
MSTKTPTLNEPKSKKRSPVLVPHEHRKGGPVRGETRTYIGLSLPGLLLLLLIFAYPIVFAGYQSVHDGNLIDTGDFIGLENYTNALTSADFWAAVRFTVLFTVVGVFGSWILGLSAALLLQQRTPLRTLFKVLLLLPWIVPIAVSAMAWSYLVGSPASPIPQLFTLFGFPPPLFLANPTLAVITVCIFKVWVSFPFMMLMSSSALAAVDPGLYEAAAVDGATRWQQFLHITLPVIRTSTLISWVLMVIFCVNDFPTIYLLTGGGPVNATTSLVVLAYAKVFLNNQIGEGVAIAFLATAALFLLSIFLFRFIKKASLAE